MQVTETLAEGLKHEFKVSVPASDLDAKADAKLVDLKDKVRLNGFRPGKVPVSHLKKVYGRSVMAETIDQTIRDTNSQIFTERGFRLATEPKVTMPTEEKEVENILAGKSDLTYTVSIEVVPAIALADFKSFTVEKPVVDVTDTDVDDAIKRIAAPAFHWFPEPIDEAVGVFALDDAEDRQRHAEEDQESRRFPQNRTGNQAGKPHQVNALECQVHVLVKEILPRQTMGTLLVN